MKLARFENASFFVAWQRVIGHGAGVRGLYVFLVFGGLVACMLAMWAHRFEPVEGASAVGVDSLVRLGGGTAGLSRDDGVMRMEAGGSSPEASFGIPGAGDARHLHVRFHASADELVAGAERWEDGRLFFEWLDGGGGVAGVARVHSASGDDASGVRELVVSRPGAGAVPVLRFQNLGNSGSYVVDFLEIVPARERAVWSVGKWGLGIGFLTALAVWCRGTKKPARWRGWVAAGIWMLVATSYAFPGPWEVARPFAVPFVMMDVGAMEVPDAGNAMGEMAVKKEHASEPMVEELPIPDDLGLRLRMWLPWLRPVLHLALLSVPVFAMAWFVGWWRAMWLGLALSVSTEASQVMFGFGFGWDDVMDLIVNAAGIAGALWVFLRYARMIHSRLPFPFPEPVAGSVADRLDE